MSGPFPSGVDLPFVVVFTASNAPLDSETVVVESITRAYDGTEVAGVAGDALTFARDGEYRYVLDAAENDRALESYVLCARMTTGSPDRAYEWAACHVRQGIYDVRRQLPAPSSDDLRTGAIDVYTWHTWTGTIDVGANLSGYNNLVLMVKDSGADADSEALLHVELPSGSGGAGLVTLNGAAYATSADGFLALTGDNLGVTFTINNTAIQSVSADLDPRRATYQLTGEITSPESRTPLASDTWTIHAGLSRA